MSTATPETESERTTMNDSLATATASNETAAPGDNNYWMESLDDRMSASNSQSNLDESAIMIESMFANYNPMELEEAIAAERDVVGSWLNVPWKQHATSWQKALEGFTQALQDLPASRKEAYTQAMQYNPQIVQIETPPEIFLLATENDYCAAAARMAFYWEKRKVKFN